MPNSLAIAESEGLIKFWSADKPKADNAMRYFKGIDG